MSMAVLENKVIKLKHQDKFLIHTETYNNTGGKTYTINIPMLRAYLEKEGFRNIEDEPVLIVGNLCKKVTPHDVFKYVLEYIETFDEAELENAFIKQGETILIKNKGVVLGLPAIEKKELRDTENASYHNFKNGIVKVEKDKPFEIINYDEAPGYVWEDRILDREFIMYEDEDLENAMFSKFLKNITLDENHFLSICSAIGYLVHKYKDQRVPVCIIINDVNIENDGKPEGGTGKGLIVKAISEIVEKAIYNGKNSDFSNNKFAYQSVTKNTNIIFIDDAPRNFDFESLFSVLTDDLPVEKKHQATKVIPYSDSPKFVITTNYTIKGFSSSSKRRRFDVFLNNHYSDQYTPSDDFKCEFFHGWNNEEFSKFDFFMMNCIRYFLSKGLIKYETEEIKLKQLMNETSSEFYELMEDNFNTKRVQYTYSEIRQKLISNFGEKYHFLEKSHKIVVEWVDRYAEFKMLKIEKIRGNNGYRFEFM